MTAMILLLRMREMWFEDTWNGRSLAANVTTLELVTEFNREAW